MLEAGCYTSMTHLNIQWTPHCISRFRIQIKLSARDKCTPLPSELVFSIRRQFCLCIALHNPEELFRLKFHLTCSPIKPLSVVGLRCATGKRRRVLHLSDVFYSSDEGICWDASEASKEGAARCHRRAKWEETELASTLIMFTTKGQSPFRKKRNALLDKRSYWSMFFKSPFEVYIRIYIYIYSERGREACISPGCVLYIIVH